MNELSAQFRRLEAQARTIQKGYGNNPRAARVINAFESSMKQRGMWFSLIEIKGLERGNLL